MCDHICVTADLIGMARAGDGEAFRQLVSPYERELRVHCYRMLGSVQDAEDAMQDALLAAWQGLGGFEGRASVRTARLLTAIAFRDGRTYRLVPTRANGQLAFGAYLHAPKPGDEQANGLLVLTLTGDRIQAMTRFTSGVLPKFGLPPT